MRILTWVSMVLMGNFWMTGAAYPQAAPVTPEGQTAATAPETSAPTPPGIACRQTAPRVRGMRLERALSRGFGLQYWGEDYSAEGLASQPHGLLIIETTKVGALYSESGREVFFTPEEIARISQNGDRPVLGYLNVGEIEHYRDYWIDFEASRKALATDPLPRWYGPNHSNGDHLSAYWVPEWRDVMMTRVDRIMATGVNGLFLDDALQYFSHASDATLAWPNGKRIDGPTEAPELARAMMQLVVDVADRVRAWNCNALVIVNNAAFIGRDGNRTDDGDEGSTVFHTYLAAMDGMMAENVLDPAADANTRTALTEDFLENGVKVLTVDVLTRHPNESPADVRKRIFDDSTRAGFVPYLADDEGFNRLAPPMIPSEKS